MATSFEQLQAMRDLPEGWDGYGAAAPQTHVIELAQEFIGVVDAVLRKSAARCGMVHVSPTRIGGVLIEWEDTSTQHEVELAPDRSISFLHRNKATGAFDTRKFSPVAPEVVHPGYAGRFVALYRGRVVGHAADDEELARRMYEKLGDVSFYIGKVQKELPVYELPSPEAAR